MQVIAIASDESSAEDSFEQAQALSVALKRAVTRSDAWTLAPGDFAMEVMALALKCKVPPNIKCQKQIAARVKAPRYVWGTMSKSGSKVTAHVRLWADGSPQSESKITYAANLTDASDEALLKIAESTLAKLTGVGTGRVTINTGKGDGEIISDGEVVGTLEDGVAELALEPGDYELVIEAAGFIKKRVDVVIAAGDDKTISAKLKKRSGPGGGGDTGDGGGDDGASGGSNKTLGYILMAGGVGSIVVGALFALQINSLDDERWAEYRSEKYFTEKTENVCETKPNNPPPADLAAEARDRCDSAATLEPLQYLFLGVGALVGGIGAYMVFFSDSGTEEAAAKRRVREAKRLRVTPRISTSSGRLDLSFRF